MTPRKILLFAAVAAALAAAAALVSRLQRPAEPSRPLAGLKPADLARIEVDFSGGHLALERAAGAWRLTAPVADEADASAADSLSQNLRGLALGSEVSRDPAGYAAYELNESSAVRVRVYSRASAAPVLDGWFGKPAMGDAVYFRSSREPAVYLAEGVQSYALRRGADDLRSKALLSLDLNDIQSLRFNTPTDFTLTKSSGSWQTVGRDFSADEAANIVLAVTSLRFIAFAKPGPEGLKADFGRPALDMTAIAKAGPSERILIGRAEAGRRWAKVISRDVEGFVSGPEADALLGMVRQQKRR